MFPDERRVAVWDVREGWFDEHTDGRNQWLKDQNLPARYIYRAEFYDSNLGARVKIYSYAANERGLRYWNDGHIPRPHDHRACYIVEDPPRWVPLDELPPWKLLTINGQQVGV